MKHENNKNIPALFFFAALLFSFSLHAEQCPDKELKFSFQDLSLRAAFAVLGDFGGVEYVLDESVCESVPISFDCTNWQAAAYNLAKQHNLLVIFEGGTMYVTKKYQDSKHGMPCHKHSAEAKKL